MITFERLRMVANQIIQWRGQEEKGDCVQLCFDIRSVLTTGRLAPETKLKFIQEQVESVVSVKQEQDPGRSIKESPVRYGNVIKMCQRDPRGVLSPHSTDQLSEQKDGTFTQQTVINLVDGKASFKRIAFEKLREGLEKMQTNIVFIGIGRTGASPRQANESPGHLCAAIQTKRGWKVMDVQYLRVQRPVQRQYVICDPEMFIRHYGQSSEFAHQCSILPVTRIRQLFDNASSHASPSADNA